MGSLISPAAGTGHAPPHLGPAPAPHAANTPDPPKLTPAAEKALRLAADRLLRAQQEAAKDRDAIADLHQRVLRRAREARLLTLSGTDRRSERGLGFLFDERRAASWRWWRLECARRAAAEAVGWGPAGSTADWLGYADLYPPPALEAVCQPRVLLAVA